MRECHRRFQVFCDDAKQFFADRCLLPVAEFSFTHVAERDVPAHTSAYQCIKCLKDVRGNKGYTWNGTCYWCLECERKEREENP